MNRTCVKRSRISFMTAMNTQGSIEHLGKERGESYERIRTWTGRSDHHRVPSPQMDHRDLI